MSEKRLNEKMSLVQSVGLPQNAFKIYPEG